MDEITDNNMPYKQLSITIKKENYELLKKMAEKENRSISNMIDVMITAFEDSVLKDG